MPRDGSNIYHRPAGTDGVPNTTVASTPYNSYTADVEQDLNLPRPIVAGGTGASSVVGALANLKAEQYQQVVTNWDAMVWAPGSFYAATTATGTSPVAGHAFAGVVYYANASDFVLQAIDLTSAGHEQFVRIMSAGVWGAWAADDASTYVKKAGDTMTGDLTINSPFLTVSAAAPSLNLTKSASGNASGIMSRLGAALRWILLPGDTTAETGSNVGSDFVLQAYTDAAAPVTPPALTIKRALNRLLLAGDPVAALDAATKQYVDNTTVGAAGDTMTGLLLLSGDPAAALGAATKQYVDTLRTYVDLLNGAVQRKNYIINGAMQVNQENPSTVVTGTSSIRYPVDQFYFNQVTGGGLSGQQVVSPTPGGSQNRLRCVVTAPDVAVAAGDVATIGTRIEGLRAQDLRFGSASAKTITLQFGVQAPAGTYCVSIRNAAANRNYVTEFTISAGEANTAVVKSVTLTGDLTGTWATDSTLGLDIAWCLMGGTTYQGSANAWQAGNLVATANQFNFMATNGNTFELFDVSLTQGTSAPPFQVPDYPSELDACKRYFQQIAGLSCLAASGVNYQATSIIAMTPLPVSLRAGVITFSWSAGDFQIYSNNAAYSISSITQDLVSDNSVRHTVNTAGPLPVGSACMIIGIAGTARWKYDARL